MKKPILEKVNMHEDISFCLRDAYELKTKESGDSLTKAFEEYGIVMSCIRLEDKLNNLKELIKGQQFRSKDIEDSLMDLAGYAIATIIEIKIKED